MPSSLAGREWGRHENEAPHQAHAVFAFPSVLKQEPAAGLLSVPPPPLPAERGQSKTLPNDLLIIKLAT